jgi:hypothetical protein
MKGAPAELLKSKMRMADGQGLGRLKLFPVGLSRVWSKY